MTNQETWWHCHVDKLYETWKLVLVLDMGMPGNTTPLTMGTLKWVHWGKYYIYIYILF
jgi:hypothetical protein